MTDDGVVVLCDLEEAQDLVRRIKEATQNLWEVLDEAHEREAWRPLGYKSWNKFVAAEFEIGKSRSFQLLHHAAIKRGLSGASEVPNAKPQVKRSTIVDSLSEEQTRALPKGHAKETLDAARKATGLDSPPAKALTAAAKSILGKPIQDPPSDAIEPAQIVDVIDDLESVSSRLTAFRSEMNTDQCFGVVKTLMDLLDTFAPDRLVKNTPKPRAVPPRPVPTDVTPVRTNGNRRDVTPILKGAKK